MQTPMARMRESFTTLKKLLSGSFNELNLNYVEPKFIGIDYRNREKESHTKGVKNDFIRIFKSNDSEMSFAFAFNNFKENIEQTRVSLTVKSAKGKLMVDKQMDLEEAKEGLRRLNKSFKNTKKLNDRYVFQYISEVFGLEEIKVSESFSDELKKLSLFLAKEETVYLDIKKQADQSQAKYDKEQEKIQHLVTAYKKELEQKHKIDQLRHEAADGEESVTKFENKTFKKVDKFFIDNNVGMVKSKWNSLRNRSGIKFGYLLSKILNNKY